MVEVSEETDGYVLLFSSFVGSTTETRRLGPSPRRSHRIRVDPSKILRV